MKSVMSQKVHSIRSNLFKFKALHLNLVSRIAQFFPSLWKDTRVTSLEVDSYSEKQ